MEQHSFCGIRTPVNRVCALSGDSGMARIGGLGTILVCIGVRDSYINFSIMTFSHRLTAQTRYLTGLIMDIRVKDE